MYYDTAVIINIVNRYDSLTPIIIIVYSHKYYTRLWNTTYRTNFFYLELNLKT